VNYCSADDEMTHIIAISNQKGGVGKTTTCISIGACLAEAGYKTLIVDLDSQANLTMAAGLDPDELEWSLPDLFGVDDEEEKPEIDDVLHHSLMAGLDILPSDLRLASVEREFYQRNGYEYLLKQALEPFEEIYSYVLIDCPPSLSALTITALTAADLVLVPVQCEYYAARGVVRLLDITRVIQQKTNPKLDYRLVATLFDKRNAICRKVIEQLKINFQNRLYNSVINIDTRLRESAVVGETILQYAPKSRSSDNYRQLTREIIQSLEKHG
jgi:chromosome partitioning protein